MHAVNIHGVVLACNDEFFCPQTSEVAHVTWSHRPDASLKSLHLRVCPCKPASQVRRPTASCSVNRALAQEHLCGADFLPSTEVRQWFFTILGVNLCWCFRYICMHDLGNECKANDRIERLCVCTCAAEFLYVCGV